MMVNVAIISNGAKVYNNIVLKKLLFEAKTEK
jgi:hypothetical protein